MGQEGNTEGEEEEDPSHPQKGREGEDDTWAMARVGNDQTRGENMNRGRERKAGVTKIDHSRVSRQRETKRRTGDTAGLYALTDPISHNT